ncbi:MAG TPA: helix-turn-helix domain-containing protein [Polyangiaceae bacterium]|nr:helix-turn-helix domain-containing protein [Polyangiaceae bacterium]
MYILAGFAQLGTPKAGTRVLVLDGDPVTRDVLLTILGEGGYPADGCGSSDEAWALLERGRHAVLIAARYRNLDDGVALARRVQRERADVSVVLITAELDTAVVLAALQTGVCDFVTTSFESSMLAEHLLDVAQRSFECDGKPGVWAARPAPSPSRDPVRDVLVGESTLIEQARHDVRRALGRSAPTLIHGEAGTEKLAVARLLHGLNPPHEQPFVVVNTAHAGAREGAKEALWNDGRRGTLFFPEVSSLDAGWQMDLVKLLSEVGDGTEQPRLRIVAGLSQPPASSWEGSVLSRLFESLGSSPVTLPPLRERGRDVVILAEHVAEQVRLERGDASLRITPPALDALIAYGWPGNVDELRLAIQHAASLCTDSTIEVGDLPPCIALGASGPTDESGTRLQVQSLQDMELSYISRVLGAVGGNKASAARLLGVDRTTLYRKLQRQELNGAACSSAPASSSSAPASEAPPARRARR